MLVLKDPNLEGPHTHRTEPQTLKSKQPSKPYGACRLHGHSLQDRPASVAAPLPAHTSAGKRPHRIMVSWQQIWTKSAKLYMIYGEVSKSGVIVSLIYGAFQVNIETCQFSSVEHIEKPIWLDAFATI